MISRIIKKGKIKKEQDNGCKKTANENSNKQKTAPSLINTLVKANNLFFTFTDSILKENTGYAH